MCQNVDLAPASAPFLFTNLTVKVASSAQSWLPKDLFVVPQALVLSGPVTQPGLHGPLTTQMCLNRPTSLTSSHAFCLGLQLLLQIDVRETCLAGVASHLTPSLWRPCVTGMATCPGLEFWKKEEVSSVLLFGYWDSNLA